MRSNWKNKKPHKCWSIQQKGTNTPTRKEIGGKEWEETHQNIRGEKNMFFQYDKQNKDISIILNLSLYNTSCINNYFLKYQSLNCEVLLMTLENVLSQSCLHVKSNWLGSEMNSRETKRFG